MTVGSGMASPGAGSTCECVAELHHATLFIAAVAGLDWIIRASERD